LSDIPVSNWTVPPYVAGSSGGLSRMTDATPPRVFVGVQPCRIADTRGGSGFPAGFGAPGLSPGVPRSFDLDAGPCPGLPAAIDAYSLNVTVTNTGGPGHLVIYPTGGAQPTVSSINYVAGQTIANAVIVPAGTLGAVTVVAGVSPTDLLIDINGYFSSTLGTPQNFLQITNNSSAYTILATNDSLTCPGPCGIRANVFSTAGGYAIAGYAVSNSGPNYGVYGEVSSPSAAASGVRGIASAASNNPTYGVHGETHSSMSEAAGVVGHATNVTANGGRFTNALVGSVNLATQVSGENHAVFASAGMKIRASALEISPGPKNFIAPHPQDPSLEIRYASVEAPTVDVYFRGTASLVNGSARIEVPDHFRFTAREGTYMTTLTPLDSAVPLRVAEEGPEGIVVRGAGNTRFHYVVYAERAEIVGYEPVIKNTGFTPEALEKLGGPQTLPEPTRALLISNGTINADGSYNLETARAQGWTIPTRAEPPTAVQP
jgi:hypothetical protein